MSDLHTHDVTHETPTPLDARVERPQRVADVADLLRDTSGSVLVRGGATKLDWGGRTRTPDLVIDTCDLTGVLTHNPADMTASVRGGTSLAGLQEHLRRSGQWLAVDPATEPLGASVGGLLSTGDSGPARLRYGGLRDLVIGVTLVLADGHVARSGGHVIKNVAGYDLAKLMHGSLGSLALIAEVVVRLHPRPPSSVTVSGAADAGQATAAALALAASPLEPAALEWVSDAASGAAAGRLVVRTEGTDGHVDAAGARLLELLRTHGVDAHRLDDPGQAAAEWRAQGQAVVGATGETVLRVCGLPSDVGWLVERAGSIAADADLGLEVASSVALGISTIRLGGGAAAEHARTVSALRLEAVARGASVLMRSRPEGVDELVDALGPPPSAVALLRRVKEQFDPGSRLAPGRFEPWY